MAGIVHYSSKFESSITSVERIIEYQKTPHEVILKYSFFFNKYIFKIYDRKLQPKLIQIQKISNGRLMLQLNF
jgi:hypothetical protein